MMFEDYSVGIAKGEESIILPMYWLGNTLRNSWCNSKINKHRKITKIDKKKIKAKRRMSKQGRKRNR